MANTSLLPLVTFEYPDSESNLLKRRYVRALEMDSVYVSGYELPHELATVETGKFKKYRLARIAHNGVALCSFKHT